MPNFYSHIIFLSVVELLHIPGAGPLHLFWRPITYFKNRGGAHPGPQHLSAIVWNGEPPECTKLETRGGRIWNRTGIVVGLLNSLSNRWGAVVSDCRIKTSEAHARAIYGALLSSPSCLFLCFCFRPSSRLSSPFDERERRA